MPNLNEDAVNDVIERYDLRGYGREVEDDFCGMAWPDYDEFKNWPAPFISNPTALREYLAAIDIKGATISEIAIVRDYVWELSGRSCCKYPPWYKIEDLDHRAYYDANVKYCFIKYEDPIVILTDKGNFEIWYAAPSLLRLSKGKINQSRYAYFEDRGWDIRKIFACVQGRKIVDFIVDERRESPFVKEYEGVYGIFYNRNQDTFFANLMFILDNGQAIKFTTDYDTGIMALIEVNGDIASLPEGGSNYLKDSYWDKIKK